jgi:hypothetical protein
MRKACEKLANTRRRCKKVQAFDLRPESASFNAPKR